MPTTIEQLYANYADGVMQRDVDLWSRCWAEQGEWRFRDQIILGRQAITQVWQAAMAGYQRVDFFSQLGPLEMRGSEARLRSYTFEMIETLSGEVRLQTGAYEDRLLCQGGIWRFSARSFTVRSARILAQAAS